MLIQVDKFYYPVDFIVLDTQPVVNASNEIPIILGRPFLATANALINCRNGIMNLSFGNMTVELNIFDACKYPSGNDDIHEVSMIDTIVHEKLSHLEAKDALEASLLNLLDFDEDGSIEEINSLLDSSPLLDTDKWRSRFESLPISETKPLPSSIEFPKLDLKPLPSDLKYAFLGQNETFPVIISAELNEEQEEMLLNVLRKHKSAIGWTIADLKGIDPSICTHKINLEENARPCRQGQRRLNPHMKEVVKAEILKLLEVGMIYPISDSEWVSPT